MSANVLEINNILNDFDEQKVLQVLEYAKSLINSKNKKDDTESEDKYKFFWEMREELKERGLQEMTLEEINQEIAEARKERKINLKKYQNPKRKNKPFDVDAFVKELREGWN